MTLQDLKSLKFKFFSAFQFRSWNAENGQILSTIYKNI